MKKSLFLLVLSLWPLWSHGQVVVSPIQFKLNGTTTTGQVSRDLSIYPYKTGFAALKAAVEARQLSVTITSGSRSGQVLAALTTNPDPPTNGTVASSLLSAQYSYNATTRALDIEAAPVGGSALELKIEPVSGTLPAFQSSGGQALSAGTYYPPGPLTGQGTYIQEWSYRATSASGSGIPQVALRLTFRRTSDGQTFTHVFTPGTATRQLIINASGGGGVTNPPTGTYLSFNRAYFLGNSFTSHAASTVVDWFQNNGMAASSPETDYVHVMAAALRTANPSFDFIASGKGSGLELAYENPDAIDYSEITQEVNQKWAGQPVDLLVVSIGENTKYEPFYPTQFATMLDRAIAAVPKTSGCTIVFRNSCWSGNDPANGALLQYAMARGYKWADMSDIREVSDNQGNRSSPYYATSYTNAGVRRHFNDAGHAAIATRFLNQLKTTTGGGGTTTDPNYVALAETSRPGNNQGYIDNGTLRVGVDLTVGGVVAYIYSNGNNSYNYVNNPYWGNGNLDKGRQLQYMVYASPDGSVVANGEGAYEEAGQSTRYWRGRSQNGTRGTPGSADYGASIGYNIVEGGDEGQNGVSGDVLTYHNQNNVIYTKGNGRQWDMDNIPGKVDIEKWVHFVAGYSNVFRVHYRITMKRTDSPWGSRFSFRYAPQELPCFYTHPDFRTYKYCQAQPYTNAGLNSRTGGPGINSNSVETTENFIIAQRPDGRCIGLIGDFGRFNTGNFDDAAYVNHDPNLHFDPTNAVIEGDNYVVIGTEAEVRAFYYSLPHKTGKPEYVFNSRSRHAFSYHHGKDQFETNVTDGLQVRANLDSEGGGRDYQWRAPNQWVDGRAVKKIYIRASFTGASKYMWFNWRKAGNSTDYHKAFEVINDGQVRTYEVDLTGHPDWDGQDIVMFGASHEYRGQDGGWPDVTNDLWNIKWISWRILN